MSRDLDSYLSTCVVRILPMKCLLLTTLQQMPKLDWISWRIPGDKLMLGKALHHSKNWDLGCLGKGSIFLACRSNWLCTNTCMDTYSRPIRLLQALSGSWSQLLCLEFVNHGLTTYMRNILRRPNIPKPSWRCLPKTSLVGEGHDT